MSLTAMHNVGAAEAVESPLDEARALLRRLFHPISSAVIGRDHVIELVLIALVADGHVLLEDFPGSGKTTLAKALGTSMVDDRPASEKGIIEQFRRIQFTPDLLPSDVTGTSIFEPQIGLQFQPGPVFAHVVLADEINRTSPKVQSALLEAMAEKQVTVDGKTQGLDELFFVVATQNPLDLAGTYPLPFAQLDRFLFKIRMAHIDRDSELEVLRTLRERSNQSSKASVKRSELLWVRSVTLEQVNVHPFIHEAMVDAARSLREDPRVVQGVSTRALVVAIPALQTRAMLYGRNYVDASDLEALLPHVFSHRIDLGPVSDQPEFVVQDALRPALERLAKQTLRAAY